MIRGTHNYLDWSVYKYVIDTFWNMSYKCGFCPCKLSSLQPIEFFSECGANSDVFSKEVMSVSRFREENSLPFAVLMPECTNPLVKILKDIDGVRHIHPKLAYCQNLWRYNRPQKGRLREFIQCGWECFDDNVSDLEIIYYAADLLNTLNIPYTLHINHLGNLEYQLEYSLFIKKYMQNILDQNLSDNGYLRLLDKQNIDIPEYPLPENYKQELDHLVNGLKELNIHTQINRKLVRGLDYYDDIVFEFIVNEQAVLAGGKYTRMTNIWKHPARAIGWAVGIERIVQYINYNTKYKTIYFAGKFENLIKLRNLNLPISGCKDDIKFLKKGEWIVREHLNEFKFIHKDYKESFDYLHFLKIFYE